MSLLKIGTPLWKLPSVLSVANKWSNTRPVLPSATTADHSEFVGVTVRDDESVGTGRGLQVQRTGDILVRVLGPVSFGEVVGQVVGADYLSSSSTTFPVGTSLQTIAAPTIAGTATLIKVRTSSASTGRTDGFPFQIIKESETQVKIASTSAILRGLDCKDNINILGLSAPLVVQRGYKIYLEIIFDRLQNAILASVGTSAGWYGFPKLVRAVKSTEIALEQTRLTAEFANHVGILSGVNTTNLATVSSKLGEFTIGAVYKQLYAYALIGFCTGGEGASGLKLAGGGTPFTVVQTLKTDLMLTGFCDNGVPSSAPIPYISPFVETLTTPTIVKTVGSNTVVLSVVGFLNASIFYSLDGGAYLPYTVPIQILTTGIHTVHAYATQTGYFDSEVGVLSFNQN